MPERTSAAGRHRRPAGTRRRARRAGRPGNVGQPPVVGQGSQRRRKAGSSAVARVSAVSSPSGPAPASLVARLTQRRRQVGRRRVDTLEDGVHGGPELDARSAGRASVTADQVRRPESPAASRRDHGGGGQDADSSSSSSELGLAADGCEGSSVPWTAAVSREYDVRRHSRSSCAIEGAHAERRLRLSDRPPRGQFT